jgi:hypothetical protein|tara:strand:+ start:2294 stop:2785 length:492 start_codon:yes stop_codon:yes gene_type:complete
MKKEFTKKEAKQRKKRADKWFAAHGINPNTKGNMYQDRILDLAPVPQWKDDTDGVINFPCSISVQSYLFYTHIEVNFTDTTTNISYRFEGGSGGIGVGSCTSFGDIYFGNLETLLKATTFGVFFGAEGAGAVQVTWGTSGNATAVCSGEGAGAFGGSGSWKTI